MTHPVFSDNLSWQTAPVGFFFINLYWESRIIIILHNFYTREAHVLINLAKRCQEIIIYDKRIREFINNCQKSAYTVGGGCPQLCPRAVLPLSSDASGVVVHISQRGADKSGWVLEFVDHCAASYSSYTRVHRWLSWGPCFEIVVWLPYDSLWSCPRLVNHKSMWA